MFESCFIYFFPVIIHIPDEKEKQFLNLLLVSNSALNEEEVNFYSELIYKFEYVLDFNGAINNYHFRSKIINQQLKTALISILIDSYAHNISAHSLGALKWWMELRNKMLDKRFKIPESGQLLSCIQPCLYNVSDQHGKISEIYYKALGKTDSTYNNNYYSLYDFLQFIEPDYLKSLFQINSEVEDKDRKKFKPRFPVPIDYALVPFFRFLRDKGAFWSGVTRDTDFGGETKTWFRILWDDFANNPLYLGTIIGEIGRNSQSLNIYLKAKIGRKEIEGRFVTIDLSVIEYESALAESETLEIDVEKSYKYSKYAFINLGEQFAKFRELLDDEDSANVFLPGGIVGEHALFTIFENTIRNIKHYKENLNNIAKEGIDLWISIEDEFLEIDNPRSNSPKNKENGKAQEISKKSQLFKVGVWLGHETEIVKDRSIEGKLVKISNNDEKEEIQGKFIISKRKENSIKGKFSYIKDELEECFLIDSNNETIEEFEIDILPGKVKLNNNTDSDLKTIYIEVNKNEKLEPFYLLFNITEQTFKPILDENGTPRMGGNSQDKACAAMLFNNKFGHVETKEKPRDRKYFPWILFSTSCNSNDYILNYSFNTKPEEIEKLKRVYESSFLCNGKLGLLKKYFYLWRGEDVLDKSALDADDWENPARAKFMVNEKKYNDEEINIYRKYGIIRIIELSNKKEINDIYRIG